MIGVRRAGQAASPSRYVPDFTGSGNAIFAILVMWKCDGQRGEEKNTGLCVVIAGAFLIGFASVRVYNMHAGGMGMPSVTPMIDGDTPPFPSAGDGAPAEQREPREPIPVFLIGAMKCGPSKVCCC